MLFASSLGRFFQVVVALGALAWIAGTTWFGYQMTGLQYAGTKDAERYSQMGPMVLGIFVLLGIMIAWKIFAPALAPAGKKSASVGIELPIADADIDAIIARHTRGQLPGASLSSPSIQSERRVTPERRSAQRSAGFGRRTV